MRVRAEHVTESLDRPVTDTVFVVLRRSHPGQVIHSIHKRFDTAAAEAISAAMIDGGYGSEGPELNSDDIYWANTEPGRPAGSLVLEDGELTLFVGGSETNFCVQWKEVEE